MVVKRLTSQGNSSALIIDRTMLDLLEIDQDTPLKLTVDGKRLIVEALTEQERSDRVSHLIERSGEKNAELFKRLAK